MQLRRTHMLIALVTALAVLLSACGFRVQESDATENIRLPEPSQEPVNMLLGEKSYGTVTELTLYYAMSDGTSFSEVTRSIEADSGESLINAAVNALLTPSPNGEKLYFSTGDTRLLSSEFACGIATVNLSIDARSVQNEQEMLALTVSIGNTLLGINGVKGVNVLIGNQVEGFCQLPFGLQTEVITSIAGAYAQLQAEQDHFLAEGTMPITRRVALYFPTDESIWLVPEIHEVVFDSGNYASVLLEALKTAPEMSTCATTAIPDGVELLDADPEIRTLSTGEHVLELNFSSTLANYLAFSGLEVWELVSSITMTMCSFIPGLDAVRVLINNEPITICEFGDSIATFPGGLIRRSDFTSRIGSIAALYLADAGNALMSVECAVSMKSALSPRSLLAELFSYSGKPGAGSVFPVGEPLYPEDVLGVSVSDGIAKVNLSANFYRICQGLSETAERNCVYSMVNTLCRLDGIRAVRFYIEGISADTLAGNIYLKSPLMPNPGIVTVSENAQPFTDAP